MADFNAPAGRAALDDAAIDAAGFLGMPAELVDGEAPFAPRLGQRLAGFQHHAAGGVLASRQHDVGGLVQQVGPGPGRRGAPGLQPLFGGGDGLFHIRHRRRGRCADHLARRRVGYLDLAGAAALAPLPADQQPVILIHFILAQRLLQCIA